MNVKQVSIDRYADVKKLNKNIEIVHLRKFVSRKLIKIIIQKCPHLKLVSLPEKLYSKCFWVKDFGINITISKKGLGRQSILEKMFLQKKAFSMKFKSLDVKNNEAIL
ncbi:MAG: hypothetical protein N3E38_02410 [Candidatus Aenigmarchaeota archaeon]|nr:hypothetical protein [Candidatus Aenigmarchaeota archaeon]